MAIFSSNQPSLRARILPRFPAQVLAGNGITITKSGGTYIFAVTDPQLLLEVVDKGTVSSGSVAFDVGAGSKQKVTLGAPLTASLAGWAPTGFYSEIDIQIVNGGLGVTWPTVNWVRGDGTNSTSFASLGVALNVAGTNFVVIWTTDGGTTLYGRAA